MGGVDLADVLIALYRTKIMVEKRWHLQVIFHALDICKIKGWLLYRRYCHEQAVPKTDQKPLLAFISELAGWGTQTCRKIKSKENRWQGLQINLCLQLQALVRKLLLTHHSLM